jgi:hypothetical protein
MNVITAIGYSSAKEAAAPTGPLRTPPLCSAEPSCFIPSLRRYRKNSPTIRLAAKQPKCCSKIAFQSP